MKSAFSPTVDIAIIGDGLTGLCLALVLGCQKPTWNIVVISSRDSRNGVDMKTASGHITGRADRQIVLAECSRRVFERCGLWTAIELQSAAISQIDVSDRGHLGHSRLNASEQELAAYGYVLSAQILADVMAGKLANLANVARITDAEALNLTPMSAGVVVAFGSRSVCAGLVLLANGEAPEMARNLGIQFKRKDYKRCALTAELIMAETSPELAYERFAESGPIALLPLRNIDNRQRASLVWTLPPNQAEQLLVADETNFIEQFYESFGRRAGKVTAVDNKALVPLASTIALEQVRSNLVLMGSAAHSLHPVAGQGFNLTIRDILTLGEVLYEAREKGRSPGDLAVLQCYERQRETDQEAIIAFSDILPRVFASNDPFLSVSRNLALLGMDIAPGLRDVFARFGAGLLTREARFYG